MRHAGSSAVLMTLLVLTASGCCYMSSRVAASATTLAPLPLGPTKLLMATIDKGVSGHILVVEATMQELGIIPPGDMMTMYPDVNGLGMQPDTSSPSAAKVYKICFDPYLQQDGNGEYPVCGFSAVWWLDLDAAEAAHPGTVIDKPLVVTLNTETSYGNIANANVALVAHMTRK